MPKKKAEFHIIPLGYAKVMKSFGLEQKSMFYFTQDTLLTSGKSENEVTIITAFMQPKWDLGETISAYTPRELSDACEVYKKVHGKIKYIWLAIKLIIFSRWYAFFSKRNKIKEYNV